MVDTPQISSSVKLSKISLFAQLVGCAILFYFLFWRVCMTTDWAGYEFNYYNPGYWDLGIIFNFLVEWARDNDLGYIAVFRCYTLLSFFLYVYLLGLISPRYIWVLYFTMLLISYISQINLIRYYVAFPLFMVGYYQVCCRKKYCLGIFFLLFPCFFHTGILPLYLLLPLYWWCERKISRWIKLTPIFLGAVGVSLLFSGSLPMPATLAQIFSGYIERYQDEMRITGILYNSLFLMVWIILLVYWKRYWQGKMADKSMFSALYLLSLTPFFFVLLVFHSGGGVLARYFLPFLPIWFGFLWYPLQYQKGSLFAEKLIIWGVVFLIFFWRIIFPIIWGGSDIIIMRLFEIEFLPFS